MDFRDYKTASRYAAAINSGYSACLNRQPRDSNPHSAGADRDAWHHGWDEAARSANLLLEDGDEVRN